MRKNFLALFFISMVGISHAQDFSELVKKTIPALVYIEVRNFDGNTSGSGFFFDKKLVMTNAHVAQNAVRIFVKPGTMDMFFPAKVVRTGFGTMTANDGGVDLAILEVDIPDGIYEILKIADKIPAAGSPILVMGAPSRLENSISSGVISNIRAESGVSVIQFSAPISGGSSGGPIINMVGEVVGVSAISYTKVDPTKQNLNFGVSALSIRAFIDNVQAFNEWGGRFHLPVGTDAAPAELLPVSSDAKMFNEAYLKCLGQTPNGDQVYIDERSVVRSSNMLNVWVRFGLGDFTSKRIAILPQYRNSVKVPQYLEVNYSFNLANNMFSLKSSILHGDGHVVGKENYPESYVFMVPGSVQDSIYKNFLKGL